MFKNRADAAHQLVEKLQAYKNSKGTIILAIPRGGLEIGAILRDELHLPLDIVVTKKIGAPGNEEYAIGVVEPDGMVELNEEFIRQYGISPDYIKQQTDKIKPLIQECYRDYRNGNINPPELKGKIVIIVDDGIATGFTTLAAIKYVRRHMAKKIILGVPVMPRSAYQKLLENVDEIICLDIHDDFYAVAQFYQDFDQVEDVQAKKFLNFKKDDIIKAAS